MMRGREDSLASVVDRAIALLGRYCTSAPEPAADPGPSPAWLPDPPPELERLIEALARLR